MGLFGSNKSKEGNEHNNRIYSSLDKAFALAETCKGYLNDPIFKSNLKDAGLDVNIPLHNIVGSRNRNLLKITRRSGATITIEDVDDASPLMGKAKNTRRITIQYSSRTIKVKEGTISDDILGDFKAETGIEDLSSIKKINTIRVVTFSDGEETFVTKIKYNFPEKKKGLNTGQLTLMENDEKDLKRLEETLDSVEQAEKKAGKRIDTDYKIIDDALKGFIDDQTFKGDIEELRASLTKLHNDMPHLNSDGLMKLIKMKYKSR